MWRPPGGRSGRDKLRTYGSRRPILVVPELVMSTADTEDLDSTFAELLVAVESGDANRCISFYADDAVYLGAGSPPIEGRELIYELLKDFFADWTFSFGPWTTDEIVIAGDIGILRYSGVATLTRKDGSERVSDERKFLDVYRRAADGRWLVWRHMFNLN